MAKKGSAEERDLVHKLWERNFAAMRAPASGGATKNPLPDVVAGTVNYIWLLKLRQLQKIRFTLKLLKLRRFVNFQGYLVPNRILESDSNIQNGYFWNLQILPAPVMEIIR